MTDRKQNRFVALNEIFFICQEHGTVRPYKRNLFKLAQQKLFTVSGLQTRISKDILRYVFETEIARKS